MQRARKSSSKANLGVGGFVALEPAAVNATQRVALSRASLARGAIYRTLREEVACPGPGALLDSTRFDKARVNDSLPLLAFFASVLRGALVFSAEVVALDVERFQPYKRRDSTFLAEFDFPPFVRCFLCRSAHSLLSFLNGHLATFLLAFPGQVGRT